MEKIVQAALLYDFYGELLTQKQKLIFELYYQNDLSLTEIGEEQGISRQAVADQLKRTEKILAGYEEKLKLVERFLIQKNVIVQIKELIETIEYKFELTDELIHKLEEIKKIADLIPQ